MSDEKKSSIDRRLFISKTVGTGCCMAMTTLDPSMWSNAVQAQERRNRSSDKGKKNPLLTEIAYCGLFCGACGGLQDTVKAGGQKEGACLGCKSDVLGGHCAKCKVRACAKSRQIANCGLCAEYPCDKIKEYHNDEKEGTYMAVARKNSEDFMYLGDLQVDDDWSEKQLQRWACPKCKSPFHFRSEKCPKCGGKISTVEDEATVYAKRKTPTFIEFEGKSWRNNLAYKTEVRKVGGKDALQLLGNERTIVFQPETKFRNGIIECDVAVKNYGGLAFHISEDGSEAEIVQLRFLNTKKDRNKKVLTYFLHKHWHTGWRELRKESPGKYDVETKLVKDKWVHLKLVVQDKKLDVFVDNASEPALSVTRLGKLEEGGVGVFGEDARFADFTVS